MAKPIEPTPKLSPEASVILVKRMIAADRRKKPTKGEQFYIDAIRANSGK